MQSLAASRATSRKAGRTGRPPRRTPSTGAAAVFAALRERGLSVRQWAQVRGHSERTVYQVIHVWAGRTDREPLGGIARTIIAELRAELGPDVLPPVRNPAGGSPAP